MSLFVYSVVENRNFKFLLQNQTDEYVDIEILHKVINKESHESIKVT